MLASGIEAIGGVDIVDEIEVTWLEFNGMLRDFMSCVR